MTDVVLVDEKDNEVGLKEKFAAHKIPVPLHRAISIVIFNKDKTKMLITKRAKSKPTWPHFWSNAVCSHPYRDESYEDAANRRIFEELGFKTALKEEFYFTYSAEMENKIWGEHELDHVFTGTYDGPVNPNSDEVEEIEWVAINDLRRDLVSNAKKYTPWFKIVIDKIGI
jgi:isopentenyl-diphosphate Delta-isomerase